MKDPLAIGLGALVCGTGLGGGTIVAGLVIVRAFERHPADVVMIGTAAGLAVAGNFGWWRSRGLDNISQRGVIGVLSAVGALLVGFIGWPVHRFLGLAGLIAWGLAAFAAGAAGNTWARRGSREDALKEG